VDVGRSSKQTVSLTLENIRRLSIGRKNVTMAVFETLTQYDVGFNG